MGPRPRMRHYLDTLSRRALGRSVRRTGRARPDYPPPEVSHPTEREVTLDLMAALTERAVAALQGWPPERLPHPVNTTNNLGLHLDRATAAEQAIGNRAAQVASLPAVGPLTAQAGFNQALVHTIHQLDHRSRWQERRIVELEAQLAELARAVARGRVGGATSGVAPSLAIVHADHGVLGGFERHLALVARAMEERGWSVEIIGLDARHPRTRLFGLPIEPVHLEFHRDYFAYLSLVAQAAELELSRFDVVLTTQPPTYLVRHDRKVALFYHHARQFYDLAGPYVGSRFVDEGVHEAAAASVRTIDDAGRSGVAHWLAGSATVADRLDHYWGVDASDITVYHAPPACAVPEQVPAYRADGAILHVGRMEWPKRPELAVQAIHLVSSGREARFVGGGSRAEFVASLDRRLTAEPADAAALPESATWLNQGIFTAGWQPWPDGPGRIQFLGPVGDTERDRHYREASVVVVPAHDEDYGLTALEAMAFARPVVVCADGGGLTELVDHEVTGLVVEPTAPALAAAIDRLLADPSWAAELGRAGHQRVQALDGAANLALLDKTMEQARAG